MREPSADTRLFGLLAEFSRPDALLAALDKANEAGLRRMDAYSPFPIEGLAQKLGFSELKVPWFTFWGGVAGALTGFGMQVYTNLDFPLDIGGRPLIAVPAFLLITFELTVLFAVLASILGMLLLNHLPRLHHPLFDIEDFHLASSDKFFLVVFSDDVRFDEAGTADFLHSLAPVRVVTVGHTEEPE